MTTQIREHPILFSGAMVKAILGNRKTQTRRVIKDEWWRCLDHGDEEDRARAVEMCPYGKAGDRLWVRETWQAQSLDRQWWHEVKREDRSCMNWAWTNPVERAYLPIPPRWLPAIHMPRMACRITLEIVSVRVERLQDISTEDIAAEGVTVETHDDNPANAVGYVDLSNDVRSYSTAQGCFLRLWDSINSERGYGWNVNPWVWVIEFKQVQ